MKLAAVYPLTPLQEGMLFHSLYAPGSGVYLEQLTCELQGNLDPAAFERAWARAIERHSILRTAFVWKRQAKPLQAVESRVELPLAREDWRGLPAAERQAGLAALLAEDRRRGFDLARAPLLRVALIRLEDELHQLVWTTHHLLLDGWSLPLLLREVLASYEAFSQGREPLLPAVRPFADYVAWLGRQDLSAAAAFWRRELAGFASPTPIDGEADRRGAQGRQGRDGGRPAGEAAAQGVHALRLADAESAALESAAQRRRLTLGTLVQGAWGALLGRWGGGEDVVFGVTVSGRAIDLPGVESMVGLFINTLPLRVRLGAPIGEWLSGLQDSQLELQRHEHSPLSQVQEWSEVPRGTPLFDSILAFENYPTGAALTESLATLRLVNVRFSERTNYPLTVTATPGDGLELRIAHDLSRCDGATAGRMLAHLRQLLLGIAEDLDRGGEGGVWDLPLLTAPERHQLRAEWAEWRDSPGVSTGPCLHERFAAQVHRTPAAEALVCGTERLTYLDLDRRANRLARHLRGLGVGPEDRVGVCLQRTPSLVAALLGVLKAGAAYVPLDPSYPPERLAFMAADAGLACVVIEDGLNDLLPDLQGLRRVAVGAVTGGGPDHDPGSTAVPDQLAYVIYTSGSTGRPKGVGVTHANVTRLLDATAGWFGFGAGDVWTLFHSYAFDFSVWELWGALAYGGRLVVVPFEVSRSPEAFYELLVRERVTVLNQTPSAFHQLLWAEEACRARGVDAELALAWVIFGGEALETASLAPWFERHGDQHPRLVNMYGITETTVHVTYRLLGGEDLAGGSGVSSIGRPIQDLAVHLFAPDGKLVPIGVAGEIHVGGAGLARGYLGNPELTAERFVPDPYGRAPGGRLYRSGDLAWRRPDGDLEYLGRSDQQVKVRGFRIEPGEIEAALLSHPAVRQAVVVAMETEEVRSRRLVAFVVAGEPSDERGESGLAELRGYLAAKLPEHMVPALFVPLAELPRTPSGKVDRRALAGRDLPSPIAGGAGRAYRPPLSPVERLLAGVWAEALGLPRVGADDNFFALGGDSILSLRIVAQAARAGCRITPRQLFEHPTVAELAAAASREPAPETPVETPSQAPVVGPVPLTPIQGWFFSLGLAAPHHFNQAVLLRPRGALSQALSPAVVAAAIGALLEHHDALRLRFLPESTEESGWRQWNARPEAGAAPFARVDLSAIPAGSAVLAKAFEAAAAEVQGSLDLGQGPLLRAVWLDLSASESRLLLVIHHLAVDGVSWRVLLSDLEAACRRLSLGAAPALPAKTTSFRRWAERLTEHVRSGTVDGEAELWLRQGTGPAVALPLDRPHGLPAAEAGVSTVTVELGAEETAALLREVPAAYRTRIDDVLLTALAQALALPGEALRLDLEGHGREDLLPGLDLSRTVGWFTSLYPVRLEVASSEPGAALRAVKEQLRAIPGRGVGYGLLRYLRGGDLAARLTTMPSPEVLFNYLGQLDLALPEGSLFAPAGEPVGPTESPSGEHRGHRLVINGSVLGGRLRLAWRYDGDVLDRSTVERLANECLARLSALIAHCRQRVAAGALGLTPSDVPLARLGQADLDRLGTIAAGKLVIEDLYPLSPLQEGLLFHSAADPGSGVYVEQLVCTLRGEVDAERLEEAWRQVVAATPALRSAFLWRQLDRPLQAVAARVAVELVREDWSELSPEEAERRLAALLAADRERGFDLAAPPLLRWTLVRWRGGEHRFLWSHHHLLLDGWSAGLVVGDFLDAYGALWASRVPALPRRRPYRDYIAWLERQDLAKAEAYWRHALAGFDEPTPLPVDRRALLGEPAGPVAQEEALGSTELRLPAATSLQLQAAARRRQLTLATLAQGAWALLLGSLAGEPEVVFGATVSGRPAELAGIESMVGLFINTLPVRVDLDGTARLGPWLAGLHRQLAELRQHEHVPLARIQGWSGVGPGRPLFASLLVFENYPREEAVGRGGPGFEVTAVRVIEQTNYPLTLLVVPGEELLLRLDHQRAQLDPATIARLLRQLSMLLTAMAQSAEEARPEPCLDELSPLAPAERAQLVHEWNDTAVAGEAASLVPSLFAAEARRAPAAEAVRASGESLSYGELARRVGRLARRLRALGVGPEVRVGIAVERTAALPVAVLGVLAAGGAYVPLDPAYPRERLAFMLEDSRVAVLVSEAGVAARLPESAARTLLLDEPGLFDEPDLFDPLSDDGEPLRDRLPEIEPESLAYLIYTSGSTGRPKGVQIPHGALASFLAAMRRRPGLGPGDALLAVTTLSFDIAALELLLPLTVGARVELVSREVAADGRLLRAALEASGATAMQATPATWRLLLEAGWRGDQRRQRQRLRVLCGGEALDPELARHLLAAGGELWNLYGPTETTVWSAVERVRGGGPVAVGRPIDGTAIHVLSPALAPLPVGAPGELWIGGAGVARGYLGRPELTAERFRPDPLTPALGARIYRTGDLARRLADGRIEVLGRADQQVKVRGFRIEPGEVEAALAMHPQVRESAVLALERAAGSGERRLTAFVVTAGEVAAGELRRHLATTLPEHMVPTVYVALDRLPRLPAGKVDRRALATGAASPRVEPTAVLQRDEAPGAAPPRDGMTAALPRDEVESELARIWSEVLGLGERRPGLHEPFFALGGDSILALRAVSRIGTALGVELPVRAVFDAPTIAALATRVRAGLASDDGLAAAAPAIPRLSRAVRTGGVPLSFAQEGLWFLDRMQPGSPAYNMPAAVRLTGTLDAGALRAALGGLVRRHEALRTTFGRVDGRPVQRIHEPALPELPRVDLAGLPRSHRESEALRLAAAEALRPFDLAAGPLLRATLLRLAPARGTGAVAEHVLLLTLHHIVADAWSVGVLMDEMGPLYAAGRAPATPPDIQYADFAAWQQRRLTGETLASLLDYWRRQLAGAPQVVELPADRPRPALLSSRGASLTRDLPAGAALSALARGGGATLFMALLAAFQGLLHRLTGQGSLLVGSTIAGRIRPELASVVGFFANTVALRSDLGDPAAGGPTFRELLARARETALGAYSHQELPFERLVAELAPRRDLSRSPLVQVLLQMQNVPTGTLTLPGLALAPFDAGTESAKFDLVVDIGETRGQEARGGLTAAFHYSTDLFDVATVARLAGWFSTLLAGAVAAPERRLSELALLAPGERHQLLCEWRGETGAAAGGACLHDLFAGRAAASPAAVAVVHDERHLTYGEVARRAARLARRLRRAGVGRGSLVALLLDRAGEMVIAILAVLEAGAAYVPLDPAYPPERLSFSLLDSGAEAVVIDDRTAVALPPEVAGTGVRVVRIGISAADAAAPGAPADEIDPVGSIEPVDPIGTSPADLAYVIYTSGSTGRPKGVAVPHANVAHLLAGTRERYRFATGDVWTLFHSYAFDFSVWELWGCLVHGGRLVVVPWATSRSPGAFRELLSRERVTVLNQTPSAFRQLMAADAAVEEADRLALRLVVFGGETLAPATLSPWIERHGEERPRLVNMYGITETTVHTTWRPLGRADLGGASVLGPPIPGWSVVLLDAPERGFQPVPLGVVGEICVGGAGLALGYLGRSDLTAERFVPDPLADTPGARLYRSGDLARRLPDGDLAILGRSDHQVKVRGFRIELGEIETALRRHPAVAEAVVTVAAGPVDAEARLAAYVVPAAPGSATLPGLAELRVFLAASLPDHMLPSALVALPALPLTPNGKVDRRALPPVDGLRPAGRAAEVLAPRDERERFLAGLFAEVLGMGAEPVGIGDDFFALGGSSISGAVLVNRLQEALEETVHVVAIFDAPTVVELAAYLDEHHREAVLRRWPAAASAVPARAEGLAETSRAGAWHRLAAGRWQAGEPLAVSFAQERLWFLDQLVPDNPFYNIYAAVRLSGPLVAPALEQAFSEVVRRHASLRTTFHSAGGLPVQVVAPALPVMLPAVDLAALPAGVRETELERLALAESRRPYDLAAGPLLRARLARLDRSEHVLLINVHHIVADGWSMSIFYNELAALYETARAGRPSPLPEPRWQYADFSLWQRDWLAGGPLAAQLDYWKTQLAGIPDGLDLPFDRPRPALQSFRGTQEAFVLSAERMRPLAALARARGATRAMALLAGFRALLSRASGQGDVPLGVAVANRTRSEVEGLIGFFVNTLVLRTGAAGDAGFADLIAHERTTALAAYGHQDLPFERLVEELNPGRDVARNPLVQVMFGYQNFPRSEVRVADLTFSTVNREAVDTGTSKFDLTLFLFEDGERVLGQLEYNSDLFDAATARRLTGQLASLLAGATASPEAPAAELPLLAAGERHQLLAEWNASSTPYPAGASLAALFAARVAASPAAPAVVFGAEELSYAELDRRAGRLAHRLRGMGVGPESRVGLCLPRSAGLIVGMVGIVQAGGAYVPLDPAYPAERLAFMIADSALAVVVGEEETLRHLPLPPAAVTVRLDDLSAELDEPDETTPALPIETDGASLAYVIYTSGSTGVPKGVEVPHRAVARLVLATDYVQLAPGDRVAQAASASFDAITFEVWGPLLTGGCTVGITKDEALAPAALARALAERRVTALFLTTALFNQVIRDEPAAFATLDHLLFGGEACDPRLVRLALATAPPRRLLHVYGPTESTTFAAWHPVTAVEAGASTVPLGLPLANTRLHVLDPRGLPVPPGVTGELCLGGDGLARGYTRRPELTAERFVPDPFGGVPGERLYRTGDLVRRRADGAALFLGRLDGQVKVRGFRIETGEVEARLAEHPAVRAAAVVLREDEPGERRLVAYVVQDPAWEAPEETAAQGEQVAEWSQVFDNIYDRGTGDVDPIFNISGWDSTYTGDALPKAEMREWLEDTLGRINGLPSLSTKKPHRILEIGCGTGLLLFRLAPRCETYWASDISPRALGYVASQLARQPGGLPQVRLFERPAERFEEVAPGAFDAVILNSVVQYFPSAGYLAEIVERAVETVRDGGAVFLGDLRSHSLLPAFHAAIELFQAPPELPAESLRQRVAARSLTENELAVSPAFFAALAARVPRIGRVEVFPKRGRAHNELTGFRYQVVLHVGPAPAAPPAVPWLDWRREGLSFAGLRRQLQEERPAALAVAGLSNTRVAAAAAAARLLASAQLDGILPTAREVAERAAAEAASAVDPQALCELAETLGYEIELGWAAPGPEGRFEAVLVSRGAAVRPAALLPQPVAPPGRALEELANVPLQGRFARRVAPELRSFLAARVPEPMVPAAFVLLPSLPLTANGKVDRRRLPAPDPGRFASGAEAAPKNADEARLAALWADLLGLVRVGVEDDFFALGGHSLLATQAVSRIRDAFGVEVPLRVFFTHPTVAGLASWMAGTADLPSAIQSPPIEPAPRGGDLPLSFAQERLWFLDRLDERIGVYNEAASFELAGDLDVAALHGCLLAIVRRHESLRTSFPEREGRPLQRIAAVAEFPLPMIDLAALAEARAGAEVLRLGIAQAARPFDLARGPLQRGLLVRRTPPGPPGTPGTSGTPGGGAASRHALLFSFHHIVFDGWSIGVFTRELAALYGAAVASSGREAPRSPLSPLPPLPIQYADFAVWQRRTLRGEELARQLAWWRERLTGAPVLAMPVDRPRPAILSGGGAERHLHLDADLTRRLRAVARGGEATLFMVLLAAFEAVLARWSGQTDVVVGIPIANRNRAELEGLIGFFVNMLVLRTDLGGDPPFAELVARVREVTLGAYAHQDLPFEKLVDELAPERDLQRTPLFQVSMQVLNVPPARLELAGLTSHGLPRPPRAEKFGLSLTVVEVQDELSGALEYDPDLYDGATVERLLGHYRRLLAAVAAAPGERLAGLSLLGPAEEHQALHEWNDTAELASGGCLHELVARAAAARPDAVAIDAGDAVLTYAGLARATGRLARRLRDIGMKSGVGSGVGPGAPVGLCGERSIARLVGLLAVLEAGGAFLPLDPAYPEERLAFLLRDSGVELLLAEGPMPALSRHVGWTLDISAPAVRAAPAGPLPAVDPNKPVAGLSGFPAYLLYTSGSTGQPKGVLVGHASVTNLVRAAARVCGIGPGERFLQFASPSFDASVFEIATALGTGATLCVAGREELMPGPGLLRLLAERQVTAITLPPSVLAALPPEAPGELAALRMVLAAGEALPAALASRWTLGRRGRRLINGYGPTEATVWATAEPIAPAEAGGGAGKPAIGRPLDNVEAHLFAAGGLPVLPVLSVPLGATAELYLGGSGLAHGYWRRPELTAQRFVPHPQPRRPGERLYRTGDLARRLSDGRLDYLGRADDQVKIRGFRIEPGEIEAALLRLPGIRQAAVLARSWGPGDLRLVAYLAADPQPTAAELGARLRALLPEHLVPALFTFLPSLPLTASGKVDRARLAQSDRVDSARPVSTGGTGAGRAGRAYAAPRTPVEEVLAGIWSEVLGVEQVGVDDDFFALSGNSLLATQVAYRVGQAFGVELPLRRLFERATLGEVALEIEAVFAVGAVGAAGAAGETSRGGGAAPLPPLPPLVPIPRTGLMPASFSQQWVWQLQGGAVSATLNVPLSLHLHGPLDVGAFTRALAELARRHETLRTRFHRCDDGELFQVVSPPAAGLFLWLVDLAALAAEPRDRELFRLAGEEVIRPFHILEDNLARAQLLRRGPEEHSFLFTMHHGLTDGWSMEVLQRELAALYGAFAAGRPSPLPEPVFHFADFAAWQRQTLRGETLAAQLEPWRRRLAGRPPVLELPAERPRPADLGLAAVADSFLLAGEAARDLRAMAREAGGTVAITLLAAVCAQIHLYTGETDILLSTLFAGRNRPELTGMIGLFLNTVTLRIDVSRATSFRSLMHLVREEVLFGYTHQDLPFATLLSELYPRERPTRTLLSRVAFNMLTFSDGPAAAAPAYPGLAVEAFGGMEEQAKYDLTVTCREGDDSLHCNLIGAAGLFSHAGLTRMMEDLESLLAEAIESPELPLDQLLPAPKYRPARPVSSSPASLPAPPSPDVPASPELAGSPLTD